MNTRNNMNSVFDANRYNYKRELLSNLHEASNKGNVLATSYLQNVLDACAKSNHRNNGIAVTIIRWNNGSNSVQMTERQLNGLAIMTSEAYIYIPACPVVQTTKQVSSAAPVEKNVEKVAKVVPAVSVPVWTPDPNGVRLYDKVELASVETGECRSLVIVNRGESSQADNRISIDAPIAAALLGHVDGDVVSVSTPSSTMSFVISRIVR